MSLLGIDVGTTGCKAGIFDEQGNLLSVAYREYDIQSPQPGWAQLGAAAVWSKIKAAIAEAAGSARHNPVEALCVSSLGEAVVPVSARREILSDSLLNFDARGAEFLDSLQTKISDEDLFAINGNTLGNHYSLTKLLWIKKYQPDVYENTCKFLHWGAFVSFMLGADPVVDYSLANRSLLFDINNQCWSDDLIGRFGLDVQKLPATAPSGTVIGQVTDAIATELGLARGVKIVTGGHDQCVNAVGAGVFSASTAMLGMGTYLCIVPVYRQRPDAKFMIPLGLNTEHHAAASLFVSFLYNHGGSLVKWYRDTFAAAENTLAKQQNRDVYPELFGEITDPITDILVLPHFAPTGPPEFVANSSGVITHLELSTKRADILKAILESTLFYLRQCLDPLQQSPMAAREFRAVGGGGKSDLWLQIAADIYNRPVTRPRCSEAGILGAAILAGTATGIFSSLEQAAGAMVHSDRTFEPDPARAARYQQKYEAYRSLWPMMKPLLSKCKF